MWGFSFLYLIVIIIVVVVVVVTLLLVPAVIICVAVSVILYKKRRETRYTQYEAELTYVATVDIVTLLRMKPWLHFMWPY